MSPKFSSVQFSSVTESCLALCNPMNRSTPGLPVRHNTRSLLKLMSIESGMPSNHLVLCHPLLLLPSVFLSIRVFSNESVLCIRWPKYAKASALASVFPMNIQDWFPLGWTSWISLQCISINPKLLVNSSSLPLSFGKHKVVFYVCDSISVCKWVHLYHFLDSTYKWYHKIFIFLWLISLSMIISSFIYVVTNGIISF